MRRLLILVPVSLNNSGVIMKKMILYIASLLSIATVSALEKGAVCFTFDDYHGKNWLKADAIFKKYNAHATFFVVREITPEKVEVMKKLQAAGHSVGLHGIGHRDAPRFIASHGEKWYWENEIKPQLDVCNKNGIKIRSFAYPNNRHDEKSDALLFKHFDYLRAGYGKSRKILYFPAVKEKMVLGGGGIGTYYNSKLEELKSRLDHAAKTKTVIVFFSHNIVPGAKHIHMPTEMLEALLQHAEKLGLPVIGFDQLSQHK